MNNKYEIVIGDDSPNEALVRLPYGYAIFGGSRRGREARARLFAAIDSYLQSTGRYLDATDEWTELFINLNEKDTTTPRQQAAAKGTEGICTTTQSLLGQESNVYGLRR